MVSHQSHSFGRVKILEWVGILWSSDLVLLGLRRDSGQLGILGPIMSNVFASTSTWLR